VAVTYPGFALFLTARWSIVAYLSHFHLLVGGVQITVGAPDFEPAGIRGHFLYCRNLLLHCSLVGKPSPLGSAFEKIELHFDPSQPGTVIRVHNTEDDFLFGTFH